MGSRQTFPLFTVACFGFGITSAVKIYLHYVAYQTHFSIHRHYAEARDDVIFHWSANMLSTASLVDTAWILGISVFTRCHGLQGYRPQKVPYLPLTHTARSCCGAELMESESVDANTTANM